MADVFSKEKRSEVMSRIRGSGNRDTEQVLAGLFRKNGITGWRRHRQITIRKAINSKPPTKSTSTPNRPRVRGVVTMRVRPDFVFPGLSLAVFVDGCFWHCCEKHSTIPKTNHLFWKNKLGANKLRDTDVNRVMRRNGWTVVRIWEHDLGPANGACVRRLERALLAAKLKRRRHIGQRGGPR